MKYFVADAFTDVPFQGNPAGVCLTERELPDELMQRIAAENGLPETAFLRRTAEGWHIRRFTPAFEMDLCGHATLASGFVLLEHVTPDAGEIVFSSRSGRLRVSRDGAMYTRDFPARPPQPCPVPEGLAEALGARVTECALSRDLVTVLESAEAVRALAPDFVRMRTIPNLPPVVVTAAGDDCDFVSRYFDVHDAIIEDPVTGSAHCSLAPFWSGRLGKDTLLARQLSLRGGTLRCRVDGGRVFISGSAVLYLRGEIVAPA